ncbi:MAG: PQQ-binding-like beta-propeller repeat protein [Myxococcota bacterium]
MHRAPIETSSPHHFRTDAHVDATAAFTGSREARNLPWADLATALLSLGEAKRQKVVVRLTEEPAEIALVRSGDRVLLSFYSTDTVPTVHTLNQPAPLRLLVERCATALTHQSEGSTGSALSSELDLGLARRLGSMRPAASPEIVIEERRGGQLTAPSGRTALSFGFSAAFLPAAAMAGGAFRADVHGTLFSGELWAWARGHRIPLVHGPIVLPLRKMLSAADALVDAWRHGREANVRLRWGQFMIGVRRGKDGSATLTLRGRDADAITLPALDVPSAILPIARLASDVARAAVAADRSQKRNLRIQELRDEAEGLRRAVRNRTQKSRLVNKDRERVRHLVSSAPTEKATRTPIARPGRLRYAERWNIEAEELASASTFLCGDRIVIASPERAVAIQRETSEVLWVREGIGGTSTMAHTTLLRRAENGRIELCEVTTGEAYAEARLEAERDRHGIVYHVGGPAMPPAVVLSDGPQHLSALDLRNGQALWRFRVASPVVGLQRAGRLLLLASADGSLRALEAASGELLWCFSEEACFRHAPAVAEGVVVAAAGEGHTGTLFGIDIFSGELLFSRDLGGPPNCAPFAVGRSVVVAAGARPKGFLTSINCRDGSVRWMTRDPGIVGGGVAMEIDGSVIVNSPQGRVTVIEGDDGEIRWSRLLSDPLTHEIPRRLEPVLRGGALFVPSGTIHVVRLQDGEPLGTAPSCDFVPDWLRVDERGWVYAAEESGVMSAFAPVAHLSLVPGGKRDADRPLLPRR